MSHTHMELLKRVKQGLNPSMAQLASLIGLSTSDTYALLQGQPVQVANPTALERAASLAERLLAEHIAVTPFLLKRKMFQGQTLLQAVIAEQSVDKMMSLLTTILATEAAQRDRIEKHFANRPPSPPTADFDLPY